MPPGRVVKPRRLSATFWALTARLKGTGLWDWSVVVWMCG